MWKVDTTTGVVSYPSSKKRYEAENALISGRAGEFHSQTQKYTISDTSISQPSWNAKIVSANVPYIKVSSRDPVLPKG